MLTCLGLLLPFTQKQGSKTRCHGVQAAEWSEARLPPTGLETPGETYSCGMSSCEGSSGQAHRATGEGSLWGSCLPLGTTGQEPSPGFRALQDGGSALENLRCPNQGSALKLGVHGDSILQSLARWVSQDVDKLPLLQVHAPPPSSQRTWV